MNTKISLVIAAIALGTSIAAEENKSDLEGTMFMIGGMNPVISSFANSDEIFADGGADRNENIDIGTMGKNVTFAEQFHDMDQLSSGQHRFPSTGVVTHQPFIVEKSWLEANEERLINEEPDGTNIYGFVEVL